MRQLLSISTLMICTLLTSCVSDDDFDFKNEYGTHISYVINVSKEIHSGTRANNVKNNWEYGDKINVVCGPKQFFTLKFGRNGLWSVETQPDWDIPEGVQNVSAFSYRSAEYLNHTYYPAFNWYPYFYNIEGDVFYTNDGTIELQNGILYINLRLTEKPFARLNIEGLNSNFNHLKGLFNAKTNCVLPLQFVNNSDYGMTGEIQNDESYTFLGMPEENNARTAITVYNDNYEYYSREYDKVLGQGQSVIIQGPWSSEADKWKHGYGVQRIEFNHWGDVTLFVGESKKLSYKIYPENATDKSVSWGNNSEDYISASEDGIITGKKAGSIWLSPKSNDVFQTRAANAINLCIVDENNIIGVGRESNQSGFGINFYIKYKLEVHNKSSEVVTLGNVTFSSTSQKIENMLKDFSYNLSSNTIEPLSSVTLDVTMIFDANKHYSNTGPVQSINIEHYFRGKRYTKAYTEQFDLYY